MNEREEFEKWYRDSAITRENCATVDAAWGAWQARASLPVKVPEGWQLVPKEPTEDMMQAGFDVKGSHLYGATYRAMLAAAPKEGRE